MARRPDKTPRHFGWLIESADGEQSGKIDIGWRSEPLPPQVVAEFEEIVGFLARIRPTFIDFLTLREDYLALTLLPNEMLAHLKSRRMPVLESGLTTIEMHVTVERRLGAFLASSSAFRGRMEVRQGADSSASAALKEHLSKVYDRSFGYRLCYNLRNYGQHRSNPLHIIPVEASADETGSLGYRLRLELDRDRLIESGSQFQPKVRTELTRMPKLLPLLPNCSEYYKCLFETFIWFLGRSGSDLGRAIGYEHAVRRTISDMPTGATPLIFHGKPEPIDGEFNCQTTSFSFDELALLKEVVLTGGT